MSAAQPGSGDDQRVGLQPVLAADFEALATIRVTAMRESLERLGRFDPARARDRLRQSFAPEHTQWILLDGEKIGFYALQPAPEGLCLDHLYVLPVFQNRGLGGLVLQRLIAQADEQALSIKVGALKESASNRFYQRHGFTKSGEGEWDVYYLRPGRTR